ncbi:recombinase family protein [Roseovarius sp. D0-M9]|uniref:recombinase family protein n=1 Tax=Roseovarius sp. D0-M9 TaxID=3127117 RepID=UPI00300FDD3F
MGQKIGYRRVSTVDQNLDRQDIGDVDRVFEEKLSGGNRQRPALAELILYAREGDDVIVYSIDRLARNFDDMKSNINELNDKGVIVTFCKEGLRFPPDDSNPQSKLQLHLMSAFAEFEREIIRQRQREGIAKAKERGAYTGRQVEKDHDEIARMLEATDMKISDIAGANDCNRKTVDRVLKARFGIPRAQLRLRYIEGH